ncbi:MAG: hypothetical protein ACHQ52_15325 [Candidatus Eisenbacteria bacterium]
MSGYGVQDLGVALLALGAVGWLVARRVRARRGASAPHCPDCPVATPVPGARLAPMPRVRPTAEGAALLPPRRPSLVTIQERTARPPDTGR